MMARKLSDFVPRAVIVMFVGAAFLATGKSFAEETGATQTIQVGAPTNVIVNPFVAAHGQLEPRVVAPEPQTSHRRPITYQNPFAAMSKSPPVDASLRPGPISRWRR